jgi:hypothetical protein
MSLQINIKDCIDVSKADMLHEVQNSWQDAIIESVLGEINRAEEVFNTSTDKEKGTSFIYVWKYSGTAEEIYNFEYIDLSKQETFKEIEISVIDSLIEINNRLRSSKKYTQEDKLYYRQLIKTHYLSGLKVPITGDIYKDLHNLIPDMIFYNLLGEKDDELTNFAQKVKEREINKIVKILWLTALSLKKICYSLCIGQDIQIPSNIKIIL